MLRYHPLDPSAPFAVQGNHAKGLLQVDFSSIGGDIDEYELSVEEARRFAQRLLDAASAMSTFLSTRPRRVL